MRIRKVANIEGETQDVGRTRRARIVLTSIAESLKDISYEDATKLLDVVIENTIFTSMSAMDMLSALDLAMDLGMPVQLHIREAHGECMDLLRSRAAAGTMPSGSIMHCFTGSWECAKVYLNLGMYVSLSGAVTFKNAPKLAEVAANLPLDRLLVETDCPYMAPVPLRGRRNEPAFVVHTLNKIAEIRGMDPEALAEITTRNAMRAFRIESEED